jgi:hypothetical protein
MSCVLAGGGLNDCGANSEIDDLSKSMVKDLVSISDFLPSFASHCISTRVSILVKVTVRYPKLIMGRLSRNLSPKDPKMTRLDL